MSLIFCTSATKNYLAYVRVLFESIQSLHPEARCMLMLNDTPDGKFDPADEPYEVMTTDGVQVPNFRHMMGRYALYELATAQKPFWIDHLFKTTDADTIIYLDPDILVTGRLDAVINRMNETGAALALTPHMMTPLPNDGLQPSMGLVHLSGVYNLGFAAFVRRGSYQAILDYWKTSVALSCYSASTGGYFVDQSPMAFVPGMFEDVLIWRDPAYNVAYWNLHERKLDAAGGAYTVNGKPLVFYHFSGYQPAKHPEISRYDKRTALYPALESLLTDYRARVIRHGWQQSAQWSYAYNRYASGGKVLDFHRQALRGLDPTGEVYADPLGDYGAASYERRMVDGVTGRGLVSGAALLAWRQNPDLQRKFPAPETVDECAYARYISIHAPELNPAPPLPSEGAGVNIIGNLSSPVGVGEVARQLLAGALVSGVPTAEYDLIYPTLERQPYKPQTRAGVWYDTNVFCVNADMTRYVQHYLPAGVYTRRNVAVWWWEVPEFHENGRALAGVYDELWTGSPFVADLLERHTGRPVKVFPIPVNAQSPETVNRAAFGLRDDEFVVLFVFNALSIIERKNPMGVIEAFKRAALPGARLVIKASNLARFPKEHTAIRAALESVGGLLIEEHYSRAQMLELFAAADVFLSLHRSEGYGLAMAESMAVGTPVIATGYSGNMAFMKPTNSYLVEYQLVQLDHDLRVYKRGDCWAEPDIDHAVSLLRKVYNDPNEARLKAAFAIEDMRARNLEALGEWMKGALTA